LAAAGHHPLTTWWRSELPAFYESSADTLIAMVGRGGAKSHTSAKLSLNEVLFGGWTVPPGELHFWAFVSASKDEADQRLRLLESFLRALKVPFTTDGDTIRLTELALGWRVFAGTIAAASGFRCIGYSVDEAAKLQIKGKNPLEEIVTSLNAMTVTHAAQRPKRILISSPQSKLDYFYRRWEAGNNAQQVALHAPTWVANPSVSREATLLAEPDPRYHAREYAAVPTDIEEESFFGEAVDVAIDVGRITPQPYFPGRRYIAAIDQAFKNDWFGYAVVTSEPGPVDPATQERTHRRVTVIQEAGSWKPNRMAPSALLKRLKVEVLSRFDDTERVLADQDSIAPLTELARGVGLRLAEVPWTGTGERSKLERFRAVRLAMLEGTLRIPDVSKLVEEFRSIKTVMTEAGTESIRQPRTLAGGHCDAATAAVLACSEALLNPVHFPIGSMTAWERLQRARGLQNVAAVFGGVPGSMLSPDERNRQQIAAELAEIAGYIHSGGRLPPI
jgi:hypothetical protein